MDDSDSFVVEHAKNTLLELGVEIIPLLERIEYDGFENPIQAENISDVLRCLRFQKIKSELVDWLNSKEQDLKQAIYIVSSYQFPELKFEDFLEKLRKIEQQCWKELNPLQTSFEKVEVLNKVIFDDLNFVNIHKDEVSPFEVFVNSVLDSKEGSDVSLGLIYSMIAQSLNIPIYGVATTNEYTPFALAYIDEMNLLPILKWGIYNNSVLFYINVGLRGGIIEPKVLKKSYILNGLPSDELQFKPSNNPSIVKKYLIDIKTSYSSFSQFRYKLSDIEEMIKLF